MKAFLISLLLCAGLSAQSPMSAIDVSPFTSDSGIAYAVLTYADGSVAVADANGELTTAVVKDGQWKTIHVDKTGREHEITTPKGRSDGARKASLERHVASVQLFEKAFP